MFKSRYYLPSDDIAQSVHDEEGLCPFTYDSDFDVYDNALILPLRECPEPGYGNHEGGVCDRDFNLLAGHSRSAETQRVPSMEVIRAYRADTVRRLDEGVIYGGIIYDGFGHFLMDGFVRLWYAVKHREEKLRIAFLTVGSFELEDYHHRMLGLLGIGQERVLIVKEPTEFARVIVPKQAWFTLSGAYDRELFRLAFDEIKSRITPKSEPKLYLSRSTYKSHDMFGEDYFERFFEGRGYKIIHPDEMSVEEQIAYVSGAEVVACTEGTLSHHALFARDGARFIHLMRYSMPVGGGFQGEIHAVKGIDFVFVDTELPILPNFHASYSGYLIGPTSYWDAFLHNEYGMDIHTDVFDYLDHANMKLGSYLKLYTEKTATERNFTLTYGYRFHYGEYLKHLYGGYAPSSYAKMQRAMLLNSNKAFRGRFFRYANSGSRKTVNVKLLADGRIKPVGEDALDAERFWSYLSERLYFLDRNLEPVVEFVAPHDEGEREHATYGGVVLSKVTDTCTLEALDGEEAERARHQALIKQHDDK